MIIHTKTKRLSNLIIKREPAILTKKDGSIYKITGKKRKRLSIIKGYNEDRALEVQQLYTKEIQKYLDNNPEIVSVLKEILEKE